MLNNFYNSNRIDRTFSGLNCPALIGFITVGYPDIETTLKVVPALADSGCNLIELGIPFSDPLSDGATIQRASYGALKNGVTPKVCLEVSAKLREKVDIPLIFMGYYNPILSFGIQNFVAECSLSGIDGLIVPDLPPEESKDLEEAAKEKEIHLIYLLAPTSTEKRVELVAQRSEGFIYLVSLKGITGARKDLPPDLEDFVKRVRDKTSKPLCVGFGISSPEVAKRVGKVANGIIVGSRLIEILEGGNSLREVSNFARSLKEALRR